MNYKKIKKKISDFLVRMVDAIDEYIDEMIDAVTRHFKQEEEDEIHTDCPWK